MSEGDTGLRGTILRLLGIEPSALEVHDALRDLMDENARLREICEKSSQEVQELRDLTRMLAINQAQLASDVYVIYAQVKGLRDGVEVPDDIESESDDESSPTDTDAAWVKIIRPGRRGGTGGMIN